MEIITSYLGWILLAILIVTILAYKKLSKTPNAVTSKHTAVYPVTREGDLTDKVMSSLRNCGFSNVRYDNAEKKYYALTRLSMSSWCEHIVIQVRERESKTELEFMSVCAFAFQIYDWGKNQRNYRRFVRELNKMTGAVHTSPTY